MQQLPHCSEPVLSIDKYGTGVTTASLSFFLKIPWAKKVFVQCQSKDRSLLPSSNTQLPQGEVQQTGFHRWDKTNHGVKLPRTQNSAQMLPEAGRRFPFKFLTPQVGEGPAIDGTLERFFYYTAWGIPQSALLWQPTLFTPETGFINQEMHSHLTMTKTSYHKLVYKTVTGFIEINTSRKLHRFFILTNEWHFQSVPTQLGSLNTTKYWHSCHVLIPPGPPVRLKPKQHDQHTLDSKCWTIPYSIPAILHQLLLLSCSLARNAEKWYFVLLLWKWMDYLTLLHLAF